MSSGHPWTELGEEMGAVLHPGYGDVPVVQVRVGDTLVTAERVPGQAGGYQTLVRTIYPGAESFRFGVRSSRVTSELGKLLFGTQDILVGDKSFDRRFVVQGIDEARIRALFSRPRVLELLKGYWNLSLTAGPMSRWYVGRHLEALHLMTFKSGGTLSAERLRRIFELFREILGEFGLAATGDDGEVTHLLSRLRAPGGRISVGFALWDGDIPRRQAAEKLGELRAPEAVEPLLELLADPGDGARLAAIEALVKIGDPAASKSLIEVLADPDDAVRLAAVEALERIGGPEAVEPLMEVLADPDAAVRRAAVEALERLGDPAAVPALAGLLGDHQLVGSTVLWERAARALRALGAGDLVHAFQEALQGRPGGLRDCVYGYRAAKPVARALTAVMRGSDLSAVEAAGRVLGWLGSADVLSELRALQRSTGWDRSREACRKAIAAIEAMPSLPRPADRPEEKEHDGLPRAVGSPELDATALPRSVPRDGEGHRDDDDER